MRNESFNSCLILTYLTAYHFLAISLFCAVGNVCRMYFLGNNNDIAVDFYCNTEIVLIAKYMRTNFLLRAQTLFSLICVFLYTL